MHRRKRQRGGMRAGTRRAMLAVALALATHALLLALLVLARRASPPPAPPARPVALRSLSAEQWAQNRGDSSSAPRAETPPRPVRPEEPERRPEGQVVAVPPGNEQRPENSRYLAETDNRTERQTRAREQTADYQNPMAQRTSRTATPSAGQDPAERVEISGNQGRGDDALPARPERQAGGALELPSSSRRQEVAVREDPAPGGQTIRNRARSEALSGNARGLRVAPGELGPDRRPASEGRAGAPGSLDLRPSFAALGQLEGAAANDALVDLEEGEQTALNTRQWKYSSFFNRVKQSVGSQWRPGDKIRQRDPTGRIYGYKDRHTVLGIILGRDGRIRDIRVERSSGVDFLDLEAIQAFERAQPFPNPPPGLAATDDSVRFSFGFLVEGGAPRLRLFRATP